MDENRLNERLELISDRIQHANEWLRRIYYLLSVVGISITLILLYR